MPQRNWKEGGDGGGGDSTRSIVREEGAAVRSDFRPTEMWQSGMSVPEPHVKFVTSGDVTAEALAGRERSDLRPPEMWQSGMLVPEPHVRFVTSGYVRSLRCPTADTCQQLFC